MHYEAAVLHVELGNLYVAERHAGHRFGADLRQYLKPNLLLTGTCSRRQRREPRRL